MTKILKTRHIYRYLSTTLHSQQNTHPLTQVTKIRQRVKDKRKARQQVTKKDEAKLDVKIREHVRKGTLPPQQMPNFDDE